MSIFVKVICNDSALTEAEKRQIKEQIELYVETSRIEDRSKSFLGINVYINSNLTDNSQVSQIHPRIYWTFNNAGIEIPSDAWRLFCLKCVHLKMSEHIDNVVLVLMDSDVDTNLNSYQNKGNNNHEDENSDESTKSYLAVSPKYQLCQVVMPTETQSQINRALALIRNQKKIYEEWGFSEIDPHTKTILCFYGSPGTGKTMCAHALANELGKKILIASYASIESKWVGEGPKNLQKIFKDAEEQDAILFFDEADSFLSKRVNNAETGSDKHYNRMSNEMFQLLEDYNGVIIFATNLVTDFDKAFKSRILAFVEFMKPDFEGRKILINKLTPSRLPMERSLNDEELNSLSDLAEGFSGREIRKAMLTTLAEGAMNNITSFTVSEFTTGFNSVKEETAAIEASMSNGSSVSNCIEDFLQYNSENQAIVSICQKTINQFDNVSESMLSHLRRVCKQFNMDLPDMTISYKNKNISEEVRIVAEAGRINECALFCSELVARGKINCDRDSEELNYILMELDIQNNTLYQNHAKNIHQILYQNENN